MTEEFNLWLEKAKESLDDALYSLKNHRYSLTAFCCQQALEKILKAAVIHLKNQRPRKIHDLLPLLKDSGLELSEEYTIEIAKISKFYFLVRYPDINKKFFATAEIARTTLEKTKEIYQWIEDELKKS
ncbi:MAG: HEPN protein [uncultured bacterium]|nr:MAG: HEPN protein [uncultured bacterium]